MKFDSFYEVSLPAEPPRRCRDAALALKRRPAERRRPQAVGNRPKAPPRAEECARDGGLLLVRSLAYTPWSPRPVPAVYRIQAGGGMPQVAAGNRRLVEEAARAPGLERRLCRMRRDARGDLRPAASGKAQPREAPLEVVVVQLQQSQPASLAV
jgi:hypothetical protein